MHLWQIAHFNNTAAFYSLNQEVVSFTSFLSVVLWEALSWGLIVTHEIIMRKGLVFENLDFKYMNMK